MSAAERKRLLESKSDEAWVRAGAALKCAACIALVGLLALIGATDPVADRVAAPTQASLTPIDAP